MISISATCSTFAQRNAPGERRGFARVREPGPDGRDHLGGGYRAVSGRARAAYRAQGRPMDVDATMVPANVRTAGKPDHCLMPPGDKKTNRDLARSTTLSSTLVETKTICSQNEDNWTSAAVRRAVALRSRTPGGLSSHQRGASSSSARQRAGMSHAGGRPAWSGPPVRPRQSFQAALRAGTSVASTRGERLEGC